MAWSKSFLVLALAGVWIFVGCGANPSSPDIEMTTPDSSALSIGQSAALRGGAEGRGHGALGVVYVSSQGLYYDTFVAANPLPRKGRFQELVPMDNAPSRTEYGPGDPGYLGGRWWVDANPNGYMDDGDNFFLCPLLPPGRETP